MHDSIHHISNYILKLQLCTAVLHMHVTQSAVHEAQQGESTTTESTSVLSEVYYSVGVTLLVLCGADC